MPGVSEITTEFLERLGRRGHEPLLSRAKGTLRIELVDGRKTDCWLVRMSGGDVEVEHGEGPADCVVRAPMELFDQLSSGRANPVVALLRGDLVLMGDYNLVILFQRVFPGPRRSRRRRPV